MNGRCTTSLAILAGMMLGGRIAYAQPACGYEVVVVHPDPCGILGPPPAQGLGINSFGHVAGYRVRCSDQFKQAIFWTPQAEMVDVNVPIETFVSAAYDIDGTQIVGTFDLEGDGLSGLAFLYDSQTDEFTNLGTLRGGTQSEAFSVNSAGHIAGYWGNHIIGPWQTFIWEDGVMTDLGPSIGGVSNRGLAMNEEAAITGWWRRENGSERLAFVWQDGVTTDLGPIPDGFSSEAQVINDRGDVAGWGKKFDEKLQEDVRHAFLWADGNMIDLGVLPGGNTESFAVGVNDARQVIGTSSNFGAGGSWFIWEDGVMSDLDDLVPPGINVGSAWAINDAGEIAGSARGPEGGHFVMALLIPNPSPLGDLNMDCEVGAVDVLLLLSSWGPCKNCEDCPADLNGDCTVGAGDLLILLANWG